MIKATNHFVFIIRDETETEISGMLIPGKGQEKPHWGKAYSVGPLVHDKSIKKDRKCLFFKGAGFDIEYGGETYLVIEGDRIIGVE